MISTRKTVFKHTVCSFWIFFAALFLIEYGICDSENKNKEEDSKNHVLEVNNAKKKLGLHSENIERNGVHNNNGSFGILKSLKERFKKYKQLKNSDEIYAPITSDFSKTMDDTKPMKRDKIEFKTKRLKWDDIIMNFTRNPDFLYIHNSAENPVCTFNGTTEKKYLQTPAISDDFIKAQADANGSLQKHLDDVSEIRSEIDLESFGYVSSESAEKKMNIATNFNASHLCHLHRYPFLMKPEIHVTVIDKEADINQTQLLTYKNETYPQEDVASDVSTQKKEPKIEEEKDSLETYSQFAERVAAEKKVDSVATHITNGQNAKGPKVKNKNYASPDCGSKVISANLESLHISKVINSNKDEYMLNKCKDKIWFILELCEGIQPHMFDVANFELFSNLPKDITLYGSLRYPSRDWSLLGKFLGEEGNRGIQSFPLKTSDFFKFIKVEVLTHYGTEFYCPLSLFHIYGVSEFEVIETLEDDNDDNLVDDVDSQKVEIVDEKKEKSGVIPNVIRNVLNGVLDVIKRGSLSSKALSVTSEPDSCVNLLPSLSFNTSTCYMSDSLNIILSCYFMEYKELLQQHVIKQVVQNSWFCQQLTCFICVQPDTSNDDIYDTVCNNSYVCVMLSPKHLLALCIMSNPSLFHSILTCDFKNNAPVNVSSIPVHSCGEELSQKEGNASRTVFSESDKYLAFDNNTNTGISEKTIDSYTDNRKLKAPLTSLNESDSNDDTTVNNSYTEKQNQSTEPSKLTSEAEKTEGNIYSSSNVTYDGVAAVPQIETKTSSGTSNKESVIVRLSNKIKTLEHNISISSQYLEELSRRYKKQMEEQQKQFNLTVTALNITAREAYSREALHQEQIATLKEELKEVLQEIFLLKNNYENIEGRIIKQHLSLMFVEVVILAATFWLCSAMQLRKYIKLSLKKNVLDIKNSAVDIKLLNNQNGSTAYPRVLSNSKDVIIKQEGSEVNINQLGNLKDLCLSSTYRRENASISLARLEKEKLKSCSSIDDVLMKQTCENRAELSSAGLLFSSEIDKGENLDTLPDKLSNHVSSYSGSHQDIFVENLGFSVCSHCDAVHCNSSSQNNYIVNTTNSKISKKDRKRINRKHAAMDYSSNNKNSFLNSTEKKQISANSEALKHTIKFSQKAPSTNNTSTRSYTPHHVPYLQKPELSRKDNVINDSTNSQVRLKPQDDWNWYLNQPVQITSSGGSETFSSCSDSSGNDPCNNSNKKKGHFNVQTNKCIEKE